MTSRQKQLVKKWTRLVRVQDWDITLKEKKRFKGLPLQTGWTKPMPNFKKATIAIRKGLGSKEFELTVIHELLHVLFPTVSLASLVDGAMSVELEQGIEIVARLLRELEHGRRNSCR
jgi:hypothetical protein